MLAYDQTKFIRSMTKSIARHTRKITFHIEALDDTEKSLLKKFQQPMHTKVKAPKLINQT